MISTPLPSYPLHLLLAPNRTGECPAVDRTGHPTRRSPRATMPRTATAAVSGERVPDSALDS